MAVSKSMLVLLSMVAVLAVVNADALDGELLLQLGFFLSHFQICCNVSRMKYIRF